jgi:hypothetical protein
MKGIVISGSGNAAESCIRFPEAEVEGKRSDPIIRVKARTKKEDFRYISTYAD